MESKVHVQVLHFICALALVPPFKRGARDQPAPSVQEATQGSGDVAGQGEAPATEGSTQGGTDDDAHRVTW